MKNCVLKCVLALSLASSFALAEGGFAGVEGGYDFNSKLTGGLKDNRPNIGIKGGYDFDTARVYGGYFYHTKAKDSDRETLDNITGKADYKWTTHKFVIGGDYTPTIGENLKLVAGLYTGLSILNLKANVSASNGTRTYSNTYDLTKAGFLLGARLGAEYSFDKNNALEFGLKADRSWYSAEEFDSLKTTDIGAYLSYTYKF